MLAHLTIGIVLDDKVNISLGTFIRGGGVRADDVSGATILLGDGVASDNARSDVKTTDRVSRQLKTEHTGVVIDRLNFLELERLELFGVKSMLRLFSNCSRSSSSCGLLNSRLRRAVVVHTTSNTSTSKGSEK